MAPGCIGAMAMRGGGKPGMGGEAEGRPICGCGGAQRSSMMGPLANGPLHMPFGEREAWMGDWPIPGGKPGGGMARDCWGIMPGIWECGGTAP